MVWQTLEQTLREDGNFGKTKRVISSLPLALKKVVHQSRFIVEAFGLQLGYDEPLTRPVDFQIERNKKIAIRGVNGLGKTTLLKTNSRFIKTCEW